MKKPSVKNKTAGRVQAAVEARLVDLSLQHPEFGAKRLLPLLEQADIGVSVSSVYNILKRHGLQNREKRLARIKAQQAVAASALQAGKPPPVPQAHIEKTPPSRFRPLPIARAQNSGRGSWAGTALHMLLLVLIAYLGFDTVQKLRDALPAPQAVLAAAPSPVSLADAPRPAAPPHFSEYRAIWERNLFNLSNAAAPPPKKRIEVENLVRAQKEIGLKLVGTVVADSAGLNRAFIDNLRTRTQAAYREGDKAGDVIIKKVLRNKVIIATADGDRLLALDTGETRHTSKNRTSTQRAVAKAFAPEQISGRPVSRARTRSYRLDRAAVEASLADTDQILQEVNISPYMIADRPSGFRLGTIEPGSVLARMGLRSGVVITEVNGKAITGPDQAAMFFQTLQAGGEIEFKIRRRRRTILINLNIG
jgi:type II secretion system protein C